MCVRVFLGPQFFSASEESHETGPLTSSQLTTLLTSLQHRTGRERVWTTSYGDQWMGLDAVSHLMPADMSYPLRPRTPILGSLRPQTPTLLASGPTIPVCADPPPQLTLAQAEAPRVEHDTTPAFRRFDTQHYTALATLPAAQALHQRAFALRAKQDYVAALGVHEHVLRLLQSAQEAAPTATTATDVQRLQLDTALIQRELAVTHELLGHLPSAQERHEHALALRTSVLGPDHVWVAESMTDLGVTLSRQGRYAEADGQWQQALLVLETAVGPTHPDVAETLILMAQSYLDQGQCERATPMLSRALGIAEQHVEPDRFARTLSLALHGLGGSFLSHFSNPYILR
jgi:hypothetical protein